ncbi:MAG: hypothetical protein HQ582_31545 [Planctomycetes bacterium]|nr:hypothetical protein [Planctomycetota bacterium]
MLSLRIGGWRCETCGRPHQQFVGLGIALACIIGFFVVGGIIASNLGTDKRPQSDKTTAKPKSSLDSNGKPKVNRAPLLPLPESDSEPLPESDSEPLPESDSEPLPDGGPEGQSEIRTWVSADGKFTVEARFVRFVSMAVTLQKADGTTIVVVYGDLSKDDKEYAMKAHREYVKQRARNERQPGTFRVPR